MLPAGCRICIAGFARLAGARGEPFVGFKLVCDFLDSLFCCMENQWDMVEHPHKKSKLRYEHAHRFSQNSSWANAAQENRTFNILKSVYIAGACKNYYRYLAMTLHNATATSPISLTTELLTTDQVATVLGLSSRTLAAWRSSRSSSLPYLKTGSRVRYRSQDVLAWLESRMCSSAAEVLPQGVQ